MAREATDIDKLVGRRIREIRTDAGVTLEELAPCIGVAWQQIWKYEAGHNRVSAGRLYAISQALDCDVGEFFKNAEG